MANKIKDFKNLEKERNVCKKNCLITNFYNTFRDFHRALCRRGPTRELSSAERWPTSRHTNSSNISHVTFAHHTFQEINGSI